MLECGDDVVMRAFEAIHGEMTGSFHAEIVYDDALDIIGVACIENGNECWRATLVEITFDTLMLQKKKVAKPIAAEPIAAEPIAAEPESSAGHKMRIDLDNGKYTYFFLNGHQQVFRHGEPWRDLVGDKFVYLMACRIDEQEQHIDQQEQHIRALENELASYAGDTALEEIKQRSEDDL